MKERIGAIFDLSISQVGVLDRTKEYSGCVERAEKISKMPRKRALAAEDPRIGNISDFKLAKSLGIAESTVGLARNELGIPRYYEYKQCSPETVLAQDDLGDVPDRVISERLGIAKSRVQLIRSKAGIESTVGKNGLGENAAEQRPYQPPNEFAPLLQRWGR